MVHLEYQEIRVYLGFKGYLEVKEIRYISISTYNFTTIEASDE